MNRSRLAGSRPGSSCQLWYNTESRQEGRRNFYMTFMRDALSDCKPSKFSNTEIRAAQWDRGWLRTEGKCGPSWRACTAWAGARPVTSRTPPIRAVSCIVDAGSRLFLPLMQCNSEVGQRRCLGSRGPSSLDLQAVWQGSQLVW